MGKGLFVFASLLLVSVSAVFFTVKIPLRGRAVRTIEAFPRTKVGLVESYGKLPLAFEVNRGQVSSQVIFLSRSSDYNVFLTSDEMVLSLRKPGVTDANWNQTKGERNVSRTEKWRRAHSDSRSLPRSFTPPAIVRMKLIGANRRAEVTGIDKLPGKSNYFIGNDPTKGRSEFRITARSSTARFILAST